MTPTPPFPSIAIVICTWNRCELLRQTLEAMTCLRVPAGLEWELLVVNNSCTDSTDAVIRSYESRLPVRRLFEPSQGLSNARNRALGSTAADLILWTDDDVLVDPDWLQEYVRAAADYPDAPFFGGPVEPWFEVEPQKWIQRHFDYMRGAFAVRRLGDEVRLFEPGEEPFGANMMLRRQPLDDSPFDTRLGRAGKHMLSGEETTLFNRLRRASSHPGVWVGSAPVRHFIPAERLSVDYLRSFWSGLGRSRVLLEGIPEGPYWRKAPRWAWRHRYQAVLRAALLAPWKTASWILATREAAYYDGLIDECRRAWAVRPGTPQ